MPLQLISDVYWIIKLANIIKLIFSYRLLSLQNVNTINDAGTKDMKQNTSANMNSNTKLEDNKSTSIFGISNAPNKDSYCKLSKINLLHQ